MSTVLRVLTITLCVYVNTCHALALQDLLWEVDRVHMRNRLPIFASTSVGSDWDGEGEIGERIP
jgi:hypothetical protein